MDDGQRLINRGERQSGVSQFGPSESRRRGMVRSLGVDSLSAEVMRHTVVRGERIIGIDHNIPGQDTLKRYGAARNRVGKLMLNGTAGGNVWEESDHEIWTICDVERSRSGNGGGPILGQCPGDRPIE
ncbi:MAG: hypothetical protein E8D49_02335 [Nitrospira sp.]|nr:MAG: hypothetical protein E8D49_02335 [Nitrospira sp.]